MECAQANSTQKGVHFWLLPINHLQEAAADWYWFDTVLFQKLSTGSTGCLFPRSHMNRRGVTGGNLRRGFRHLENLLACYVFNANYAIIVCLFLQSAYVVKLIFFEAVRCRPCLRTKQFNRMCLQLYDNTLSSRTVLSNALLQYCCNQDSLHITDAENEKLARATW